MLNKKKKDEVEIPSSSLADIAFLLLVFFLVCTTIDVDKGLDLTLPPADDTDVVEINRKNITNLLINDAGAILLDNQPIEVRDISGKVREMLLENDKLIVSLKTTEGTRYEVYIQVLDQLKRSGATRISIAEPEET